MTDGGTNPRPDSVRPGRPVATVALLALVSVVFAAQQALHAGPRVGTLGVNALAASALGALDHTAVGEGQWWRLITSALLHGDVFHVLFNAAALTMGGVILERLAGPAWTGALFVAGAFGGGLASLAVNAPGTISLGASGAIMGMLSGAFVIAGRVPRGFERSRLRLLLAQLAIPALVPIALVHTSGEVDFAGHVGGAVAGAAVGVLVRAGWPAVRTTPPGLAGAAAVLVAGAAAFAWGVAQVVHALPESMADAEVYARIMTDAEAAALRDMPLADLVEATRTWADDPRTHYALAHHLVGEQNDEAIRAATVALSKRDVLDVAFPDGELEAAIRVTRTLAALDAGISDVVPADIHALCGTLSATAGGAWARENDLCSR